MSGVRVRGLEKQFGNFRALKGIDLDVRPNEFLSILGPSGCGKSTLLRIIAGLESPSKGEIVIAEETVTQVPVWKRRTGFVFQNFALWPHLTVFRNVSMGLELRRRPRAEISERTMEALRLVQLDSMAERYPSQLSGGQQQRVALARAIVLKPEVLLLDEPLSALDKNLRQNMQIELKTLQQTLGLTTIFVTHDQEEALSLSDRVVVMNNGTIEQLDVPQTIYSSPASAYVASFVGEAHFFQGTIEARGEGFGLRLADGTLVPVAGGDAVAGEQRMGFVRPEWVRLRAPEAGSRNIFPAAAVERLMFFGKTSEYLVRLGDAQLRVNADAGTLAFRQDDAVILECEARLLPKSGGAAA